MGIEEERFFLDFQVILTDITECVLRIRQCAEYWGLCSEQTAAPSHPDGMDLKVMLMVKECARWRSRRVPSAGCTGLLHIPAPEGRDEGVCTMLSTQIPQHVS